MKEVIERRIARYENKDVSFASKPDLMVIDGGKGQLSSAYEIVCKRNFDVDLISLAKQFEEVYVPTSKEAVLLRRASPELTMLQRIRDEAHRLAITFHRSLRDKKMLATKKK